MKITILGLGAMGQRVAQRILEAKHEVTIWNRTKSRGDVLLANGAKWSDTPKDAVGDADFVLCCVTDDKASKEVWFDAEIGAALGLKPSVTAVEMSTISPAWAKELGKKLGDNFLEAPMVGSRPHAEAGILGLIIAGNSSRREEVEVLFSSFSGKRFWVGEEVGKAAVLKLLVNGLFAVQVATFAELLIAGSQQGLETEEVISVLQELPVSSPAAVAAAKQISARSFQPLFPIDLVSKDLNYLLDLHPENPIVNSTKGIFERASALGHGDLNITGVAKALELTEA